MQVTKTSHTFAIELTGNPFVDTGLAVISALADKDEIGNLSHGDLKRVFADGKQISLWNSKLKSFTMIFTTNSLLRNPAIKPESKRLEVYRLVLDSFLDNIGNETKTERCEACGNTRSLDLHNATEDILTRMGFKNDPRYIGRDWFPLSGSIGSDAQALPAASKAPTICAKCLFVVHYLPLGVELLDGKLVVYQSNFSALWYELVRNLVNQMQKRLPLGKYDILGSKEGNKAVALRLLDIFRNIKMKTGTPSVPSDEWVLYAWKFTNSGTSASCDISEIPNKALRFLYKCVEYGLDAELRKMIIAEGKNPYFSLLKCSMLGKDYPSLYPTGKWSGASPELFALYQTVIMSRGPNAVKSALKLSRLIKVAISDKEYDRITRREGLRDFAAQNQIRRCIVNAIADKELNIEDYLSLFPYSSVSGVRVETWGWEPLRFFLNHVEDGDKIGNVLDNSAILPQIDKRVNDLALWIYSRHVEQKGLQRFKKDVLDRLSRNESVINWLRNEYLRIALLNESFNYNYWERICYINERMSVRELLFQLRMLWTKWATEGTMLSVRQNNVVNEITLDIGSIPETMVKRIAEYFDQYIRSRGIGRFELDVVQRLIRKEFGLAWFHKILVRSEGSNNAKYDEIWQQLLYNNEGRSIHSERLFQLTLFAVNILHKHKTNIKVVGS